MAFFDLLKFVWNHPLNASGKLDAMERVFRWQIGSRLLPEPIALPFVEQTRLLTTRGMTGATGNWYCGLHEPNEMAFLLHLLRADDRFMDVGANIGSYTVLSAGVVGAITIAVEPVPSTFESLMRNIAINNLQERVQGCQCGLSERRGSMKFTSGLDTTNHVLGPNEQAPSVDVGVTTVDELVGKDIPALIKIDVEGYELPVLKGAENTLGHRGLLAVILEINGSGLRYSVRDDELIGHMGRFDFERYSYDPFSRQLEAPNEAQSNAVFVRDMETVSQRLASARRHKLINGSI
jgi:FkbM family methyltransferase